jgi:hypothetical protein
MACLPRYVATSTSATRIRAGEFKMSGPKQNQQKMEQLISAWRKLASNKSFGGMTQPEFEALAAPVRNAIALIVDLENQRTQAINQRDDGFTNFFAKAELVVNGVRADPTEGPDSSLIEAMGYTRKSERKSGLTRGKQPPPTT